MLVISIICTPCRINSTILVKFNRVIYEITNVSEYLTGETQHWKASTSNRVKKFESLLIDSSHEQSRYVHIQLCEKLKREVP